MGFSEDKKKKDDLHLTREGQIGAYFIFYEETPLSISSPIQSRSHDDDEAMLLLLPVLFVASVYLDAGERPAGGFLEVVCNSF